MLPADGSIRYGGSADNLRNAVSNMGENFALAIMVLFLIMAAMFRSVKDSILVVLTIPLATYLIGWESWAMLLHPIEGGLLLLRAAFEPIETWRLAASALSAGAWAALLWRASVRAYERMTRG